MIPGIPVHTAINVSYAIGGITIFLPILLVLIKTSFRKFSIVLISVLCFIISLVFREIDARSIVGLPMGTHFLWHLFSAVGAFFLAHYLYFINGVKIHTNQRPDEKDMVNNGIKSIKRKKHYQEVR
jgi:hypothetical protein